MTIKAELILQQDKLELHLAEQQGQLTVFYTDQLPTLPETPALFLLFKQQQLIEVGLTPPQPNKIPVFDTVILINPPEEIQPSDLKEAWIARTANAGLLLKTKKKTTQIPANNQSRVTEYQERLVSLLDKIGFPLQIPTSPKKNKPAKAQHRWRKELSTREFYVDDFESKATIIWQKRNEMRIKKGAVLRQNYSLNKDGSIGLDVRMATQLRNEQADKIKDFVTTEDIVLKSVNETGLFLYYGGRNGWLVFKDDAGKTIDEWSVV